MDIFCAACGEPWDTRGLHYSHSDLSATEFFNLVNGLGCPCCVDNDVHVDTPLDPSTVEQWRRSVARASEGTVFEFELEPVRKVYQEVLEETGHRDIAVAAAVNACTITRDQIGDPGG